MKRRQFLQAGASAAILSIVPWQTQAADVRSALLSSNLVYLSPIKSDGSLSSCQAEIWYVMQGTDLYVCTATSSWRAQAPRKGVTNTQFWVGDLGVWKRADYKSLPEIKGLASVETDDAKIETALQLFGQKYASGWGTWGPRFRRGLKDGSRTMLKYQLAV